MNINYDLELIRNESNIIKEKLKLALNDQEIYKDFFKGFKIYSFINNVIYFFVSTEFKKNTINNNYFSLLQNVFKETFLVNFIIKVISEIDLDEINKLSSNDNHISVQTNDSLYAKYTFDNFVIDSFNQNACTAIDTIFNKKMWRLFFISSDVGLGKTHLLNAVGNKYLTLNPTAIVKYVNSDEFIREVYSGLISGDGKTLEDIKNKYQRCDLLLFDDIQFLSRKEKINEIFFNIFNGLVNNDKIIIITSDKHPSKLENFENRMKSRFGSGLFVEIFKPSLETVITILKCKIKNLPEQYSFNNAALLYIARRNQGDIRRLEGYLNQILFYCINNLPTSSVLTVDDVRDATRTSLHEDIEKYGFDVDPNIVINQVCLAYGVSVDVVKSKSRNKQIVTARHVCMYVLRQRFKMSLVNIGNYFSNRNHSTIISSIAKIENLIEKDPNLKQFIEKIYKNI